ncbi:hypothetical protein SZ39_4976 [Bacillus mycoides]|nr:hypothetical protein SZ39_4976 [Bacillus mycoides]
MVVWGFDVIVNVISRICHKNACKGKEGPYMRFYYQFKTKSYRFEESLTVYKKDGLK